MRHGSKVLLVFIVIGLLGALGVNRETFETWDPHIDPVTRAALENYRITNGGLLVDDKGKLLVFVDSNNKQFVIEKYNGQGFYLENGVYDPNDGRRVVYDKVKSSFRIIQKSD